MVKIRLSRVGRKNLPSYKLVITPEREKRESKFIEYIGSYSPLTKEIRVDAERAKYWLSVGAQPTETVERIFIKQGLLSEAKYKKTYKKTPGKKAKERAPKAE